MMLFAPRALAALWCVVYALPQIAPVTEASNYVLSEEALSYHVEWRLIHAGNARLKWSGTGPGEGWRTGLELETVGLVSRLYKVNNVYTSRLNDRLCVEESLLKTNEGSKKRETAVTFDAERRKAKYVERDVVKNTVVGNHELDIRPCEHDVIGALYQLRTMTVPVGQSVQIPISDGKKSILARIDAQARETVKIQSVKYNTVRYEAHLFNGVLYRRSGRLFVWLTEDGRRLPVQIRIRLPFYIGTVTLELRKDTKA